eukprot:12757495-Alexandrium_andersonii.AAC.1
MPVVEPWADHAHEDGMGPPWQEVRNRRAQRQMRAAQGHWPPLPTEHWYRRPPPPPPPIPALRPW